VIIKGNQRGGGQALAAHLMNVRDNDHVELHEVRGFASHDLAGAFLEVEIAAAGTKCQQPFFSVSLNPPKGHNAGIEDFGLQNGFIKDVRVWVKGRFMPLRDRIRRL
jgi:hypothetical protein